MQMLEPLADRERGEGDEDQDYMTLVEQRITHRFIYERTRAAQRRKTTPEKQEEKDARGRRLQRRNNRHAARLTAFDFLILRHKNATEWLMEHPPPNPQLGEFESTADAEQREQRRSFLLKPEQLEALKAVAACPDLVTSDESDTEEYVDAKGQRQSRKVLLLHPITFRTAMGDWAAREMEKHRQPIFHSSLTLDRRKRCPRRGVLLPSPSSTTPKLVHHLLERPDVAKYVNFDALQELVRRNDSQYQLPNSYWGEASDGLHKPRRAKRTNKRKTSIFARPVNPKDRVEKQPAYVDQSSLPRSYSSASDSGSAGSARSHGYEAEFAEWRYSGEVNPELVQEERRRWSRPLDRSGPGSSSSSSSSSSFTIARLQQMQLQDAQPTSSASLRNGRAINELDQVAARSASPARRHTENGSGDAVTSKDAEDLFVSMRPLFLASHCHGQSSLCASSLCSLWLRLPGPGPMVSISRRIRIRCTATASSQDPSTRHSRIDLSHSHGPLLEGSPSSHGVPYACLRRRPRALPPPLLPVRLPPGLRLPPSRRA